MRKLRTVLMFATAAVLSGCSNEDDIRTPPDTVGSASVVKDVAVGFDAYMWRSITRAGHNGALSTEELKDVNVDHAGLAGFGVFGYYTDANYYTSSQVANFMYNQQVTYNASTASWGYSPVKYWPNEYGSSAESADEDKVSFFAYAPFVACDGASGKVEGDDSWGITGFSRNTYAGDPIVKYKGSFDMSKQVDLCWAVKGNADTWPTFAVSGSQTIPAGYPWLDVEHPARIDQKMVFNFLHALSQVNFQIDVDADLASHADGAGDPAAGTKVYVRSITFKGFAQQGALNLNNADANTPLWLNYNGQGELTATDKGITLYDGMRDGKEGRGIIANSETTTGFNPQIISDEGNTTEGVRGTLVNLFDVTGVPGDDAQKLAAPIYVIPTTGEPLTVTIAYDVETADDKLPDYLSDGTTHGSSVSNVITKEITFGNSDCLKVGYNYTVKLHLGLNSVKFDAVVSEWDESLDESSSWLPKPTNSGFGMTIAPAPGSGDDPIAIPASGYHLTRDLGSDPVVINITTTPADDDNVTISNTDDGVGLVEPVAAPSRAITRATQELHGIKNFKITPIGVGTCYITVTTGDGSITIEFTVSDASAALGATTSNWTIVNEEIGVTVNQ